MHYKLRMNIDTILKELGLLPAENDFINGMDGITF